MKNTAVLPHPPVSLSKPRRVFRDRQPAGWERARNLPGPNSWPLGLEREKPSPLGYGSDPPDLEDGPSSLPAHAEPVTSPGPGGGARALASAAFLAAGLGLLGLPAHHWITDDLPQAVAAGLAAVLVFWISGRLARPLSACGVKRRSWLRAAGQR